MRQPINNSSRVPRYQNSREIVGFCDFSVKFLARSALPLATGGTQERLARNLRSGSKPLLNGKKRLVMLENSFIVFKTKPLFKDMSTIVLDVQDESLLTQIKKACQLLKGVASVKVVSKREKSQACLNSSEREQAQAKLKVHKSKNEDITKTAGYKEAMDDIKHGRVTEYASLKDFYKEMGL